MALNIHVRYESSWRNSFLDGNNNEPLPKAGRNFIGSITSLKGKKDSFIRRAITKDTVMGILNRLIGDQRKLYQARQADGYYFSNIEEKVSFSKLQSEAVSNTEMIYIRNISGNEDRNSFTGIIGSSAPIFTSDYSGELWGVLNLSLEELCNFIVDADQTIPAQSFLFSPSLAIKLLDNLQNQTKKQKLVPNEGNIKQAVNQLNYHFANIEYLNSENFVTRISLYCSALYIQLMRLQLRFDISSAVNKKGNIAGISKRSFTKKDFMSHYMTCEKKLIWGNPYLLKQKKKGEGEVTSMLTKASGLVEITLDISKEKARELMQMIECAGVSTFYLGKKGLAYVEYIGEY